MVKKSYPLRESFETVNYIFLCSYKKYEVMAYSYSYIYKLQTTGLRFFTVYGPYGRPICLYLNSLNQLLTFQK